MPKIGNEYSEEVPKLYIPPIRADFNMMSIGFGLMNQFLETNE